MLQTITCMAVQKGHAQHKSRSLAVAGRKLNALQRGFSLVEIALVLVIAGLALGAGISLLGSQLENKKVSDTQNRIKEASEAIIAFAMVNGRLPCPAAPPATVTAVNRGLSAPLNPPIGTCTNFDGFVPARTLGLSEQGVNGNSEGITQDAWSFGLRYRVSNYFDTPGNYYPLTKADGMKGNPSFIPLIDTLKICSSATGIALPDCGTATKLASAAFVVWSTGNNGGAGSGADEAKNLDTDVLYVFHERRAATGSGGEFDDILQWRTIGSIVSNMSKAGVLP